MIIRAISPQHPQESPIVLHTAYNLRLQLKFGRIRLAWHSLFFVGGLAALLAGYNSGQQ